MVSAPLRIGIVGCGAVARLYYAPALQALERAGLLSVRALCDPDAQSLGDLRGVFPGAVTVRDVAELARLGIGLVIVASPPHLHAQHAIAALRDGMGVLCEKPMAVSVADADAMVEAARTAGRVLAVGFYRRFLPATRAIHELVASERFGPVRRFHCFEGGEFRWPARAPSYFRPAVGGGGVLADIGPHVFDLLHWWLGPPEDVAYADDAMGGVEANCCVRLGYAGGCEGEVRLSRDWAQPNRYVLECRDGWIGWTVHDADHIDMGFAGGEIAYEAALRYTARAGGTPVLGAPVRGFEGSFVDQIRNVVAAVRGDEQAVVPGAAALDATRLVADCYARRELMAMPWLPEPELARARQLSGGA